MNSVMANDNLFSLNDVPNCLVLLSDDLFILSISDYFQELKQLNAQEFIGQKLSVVLNSLFSTTQNQHYFQMEKWFEDHRDLLSDQNSKKIFAKEFHGVSYRLLASGEFSNIIILSFTDALITETTAVISDREATLQSMADDTDILISIVDDYGNLEYHNPAWNRFLGNAMQDNGRFKWEECIHPDDLLPFQKTLYQAIAQRSAFAAEFRMTDQAKKFRWLSIKGTPRTNDQGKFKGYICSGIETSDSKAQLASLAALNNDLLASHAKLKASEENLQSAFDAAEMGSCSLELSSLKAEMSTRYRQLYGLPLTGNISWEMVMKAVDPNYHKQVNEALTNAATLGTPVDSTYPIRHLESGDKRWMRVVGKVNNDAGGKPQSVYAVVMDVTKKMEEEQQKNEFIAMVSHELKTPITSISGYIQLLTHKAKRAGSYEMVPVYEKVQRQLIKMTKMIEGFLSISRLEMNQLILNKTSFEAVELMDELMGEFNNEIATHQFVFSRLRPVLVHADRDRIGMVIHNLLSNAVKYSPVGSQIEIVCTVIERNLIVSVADRGIGVEEEDRERLFDRYFRSSRSKLQTIAGFGIGLYLSDQIIKMHDGRIWVENLIGTGAKFSFSLPLSDQPLKIPSSL